MRRVILAFLVSATGFINLLPAAKAAPAINPQSPRYEDPVKQLEAEIEAGLSKLSDVMRDVAKLMKAQEGVETEEDDVESEMRESIASGAQPNETRDQKIERLTRERDTLIYIINENAVSAAERYHKPSPSIVTVETLREIVNKKQGPPPASAIAAASIDRARTAMRSGDYATAHQILPPLANGGDPAAQNMLGVLYLEGWGTKPDHAIALSWFRKSAIQGDPKGAYNLGRMYDNGWGVSKDFAEAVKWYRASADKGDASGQSILGAMYATGDGVAQDYTAAMKWYRLAADQGDPEAQRRLGLMYSEGQGVPRDDAQALSWYRKAADQGNIAGQYWVGRFYLEGRGAQKDAAMALAWLNKAASQGDPEARELLAEHPELTASVEKHESDEPVPITGDVEAPVRIAYVPPKYPEDAKKGGKKGSVVMELVVNSQGGVEKLHVLKSNPLFDAAAVEAVSQWRYKPALQLGRPVSVYLTVIVSFEP